MELLVEAFEQAEIDLDLITARLEAERDKIFVLLHSISVLETE